MSSPNTTRLYAFRHVDAPAGFLVTRVFSQYVGLGAAVMYCMFIRIVFKALQRINGRKKDESKRHTLLLLASNLVVSAITLCWNLTLIFLSGFNYDVCNYWGRSGGILYVASHFFSYLILLQRAQAVGGVFSSSSRFNRLLFNGTLFAVKLGTASVPLLAFISYFVFSGIPYFKEEFCVIIVTYQLAWLFWFLDTSLSTGYLILFILPVVVHMRKMNSSAMVKPEPASKVINAGDSGNSNVANAANNKSIKDKSAGLKATAIRNLKISSSAIGVTFVYMFGISAVATWVAGTDNETLIPYTYWLNFQMFYGTTDVLVGASLNMLMTKNLWTTEPSLKRSKLKHVGGVGGGGGGGAEPSASNNSSGTLSVLSNTTVSTTQLASFKGSRT